MRDPCFLLPLPNTPSPQAANANTQAIRELGALSYGRICVLALGVFGSGRRKEEIQVTFDVFYERTRGSNVTWVSSLSVGCFIAA